MNCSRSLKLETFRSFRIWAKDNAVILGLGGQNFHTLVSDNFGLHCTK